MSATEFPKFCISWGHTESCTLGKSSLKVFSFMQLTSAPVSTLNHNVMVVGSLRVARYGKFEVFSLIESSSVGLNMINHFKHIYPWWIWLSDSIFINVGVIIVLGAQNKVGLLGGSFLALAYLVEMSNFMTSLVLGILGWTLLTWLVVLFSTRLMTRIRRSLCSRYILSLILSITSVLFAVLALVLSMVICSKICRRTGI